MSITEAEHRYVQKRRMFARSWPLTGTILGLITLVLVAWLLWSRPLLINPFRVMSSLEANAIPDSTLRFMAAMLPVAMVMCILVLLAGLILAFVAFSNERKLLSIIDRLTGQETRDRV